MAAAAAAAAQQPQWQPWRAASPCLRAAAGANHCGQTSLSQRGRVATIQYHSPTISTCYPKVGSIPAHDRPSLSLSPRAPRACFRGDRGLVARAIASMGVSILHAPSVKPAASITRSVMRRATGYKIRPRRPTQQQQGQKPFQGRRHLRARWTVMSRTRETSSGGGRSREAPGAAGDARLALAAAFRQLDDRCRTALDREAPPQRKT